jgi:TM2 domain-containing membrane protein YozV
MDKQPTTKYTHKTKDRVSRTLLKTGGEFILPILTILTILPILFLYLNTVIVTAGTFEP